MNQIQIFTSKLILQPLLLQKVEDETLFFLGGGIVSAHERGEVSNYKKNCLHSYVILNRAENSLWFNH